MNPSIGSLPTFSDAVPLGPGDGAFVQELHALLAKHGNLDRFGLTLLHEHFAVAPGEILMESNDPSARTLHCTVERIADLPAYKETAWRLMADGRVGPLQCCGEGECKSDPCGS